jgi:hypothetical protein
VPRACPRLCAVARRPRRVTVRHARAAARAIYLGRDVRQRLVPTSLKRAVQRASSVRWSFLPASFRRRLQRYGEPALALGPVSEFAPQASHRLQGRERRRVVCLRTYACGGGIGSSCMRRLTRDQSRERGVKSSRGLRSKNTRPRKSSSRVLTLSVSGQLSRRAAMRVVRLPRACPVTGLERGEASYYAAAAKLFGGPAETAACERGGAADSDGNARHPEK